MKARALYAVIALVCLAATSIGGVVWALDEAILTPTSDNIRTAEDQAFSAAMNIWFSHRYSEGKDLLHAFAQRYPNSRWRAEAELHEGCYLTYGERYTEAKAIFERLASEFRNTNIREKAAVRLGNIAEREGRWDDAIKHYNNILKMNPTWDQFKYANFRARKLYMTRNALQAKINCGPVALAACLEKLGKSSEASTARSMSSTVDGVSLFVLAGEAEKLGVKAQSVEFPITELKAANLPILAHILPNHYIAILSINGDKAQIEDSIQGKREVSLSSLEQRWSGKAITFAPVSSLAPLSMVAALETTGGCCGKADEDECLGDPCECQQGSGGGPGGPGGDGGGGPGRSGGGCGGGCAPVSAGRPTWQVNTVNLNILVKDTPIWYNPGKGPQIAFTLTYSNENSNTGIFGRGWRCQYDMKLFFLPGYDQDHPDLQVHRDNGRIETYEYNGSAYQPRSGYAAYGYRDEIKILTSSEATAENISDGEGTVMLSLRGGGKYFFKKAGSGDTIEGRIYIIQDDVGNRVTCTYTDGVLASVTDANNRVTDIDTTGSGINERVALITLPSGDARTAEFEYTDGNLTKITDMLGDASTLSYNALLPSGATQFSASTTTTQAVTVTPLVPDNGDPLSVDSTTGFLSSGKIKVNNAEEMAYTSMTLGSFTGITRAASPSAASSGASVAQVVPTTDLESDITAADPANTEDLNVVSTASFPSSGWIAIEGANGTELINYTSKSSTAFENITRGDPAYAAAVATSDIWLCKQTPYLSEIVTPAKKTKFTYEWAGNYTTGDFIGLHEVRECGPTEASYPTSPTIHYAWTSYHTDETRYGDLTKTYDFSYYGWDQLTYVQDELGHKIVEYVYNTSTRDRTSVKNYYGTGANDYYATTYIFSDHDMTRRTDPLGNEWNYSYYTDHSLQQEQDPYGRYVKKYTYNSNGQVTKIETQLTAGTWTTLAENHYDSSNGYRMDWSKDGNGKQTTYGYNSSGFLTSVTDPLSKVTSYDYDAKGRRDEVTDPNGNTTVYTYDDLDRVTQVKYGTGANDPHVDTEYTCCHKDRVVDENGKATRYVYDVKNRPWVTISAAIDGVLSSDVSDSATSLPLSDASGFPTPPQGGHAVVVIQHSYDGRFVGLEIATYTGKSSNTLTGVTRAQYGSTAHAFNTYDRVTVSDVANDGVSLGNIVVYGYDSAYLDRMIWLKDALDHTTYYTYYANGKQESIRYPDDKGEKYAYDNSNSGNNLITKEYGTFSGSTFTANANLTVNYEYDANNRLTRTYH